MQEIQTYRHELKYDIDRSVYLSLRQRLKAIMLPDPHTGTNGTYTIRSIYFDTMSNKALREKIDGAQKREKFRIRFYNDDLSSIFLEKKQKIDSLCLKSDAAISEAECRDILDGNLDFMMDHRNGLVRELYCKIKGQGLKPRVLVSYTREPYVYAPGNVRVTFDSKIRTTLSPREFLEKNVSDICSTDTPFQMILEVKYDAFLPEIISLLLQSEGIRQTEFSKYGICRRFG